MGRWSLLLLCLVTLGVYLPTLRNDFVRWDDGTYIVNNLHIRNLSWASLHWMFTSFTASNYHPLTWLSHAIDVRLWGLNPHLHHLTNILLHTLNTGLVFLIARTLILLGMGTGRSTRPEDHRVLLPAAVTALLFGLHPLHVESVAWASERKDVLCALFYLLALHSYLRYAAPGQNDSRRRAFAATLLFFTLALLAKPMAITLPVVLLLLDGYPLRRLSEAGSGWRSCIFEKWPFFLLSVASAILTIAAQSSGSAISSLAKVPFWFRCVNALEAILFYLWKMVWPTHLSPIYEFAPVLQPWLYLFCGLGVVAISTTAALLWHRHQPLWLAAWAYFLITLLPVLGIIQVGRQMAADRYTYLPSLGPFLLAGVGVERGWRLLTHDPARWKRTATTALEVSILLALATLTVRQIHFWKDEETLWHHAIDVAPHRSYVAHDHLYLLYKEQGRTDEMIAAYKEMVVQHPGSPRTVAVMGEMGIFYAQHGQLREALDTFVDALGYQPDSATLHTNLARVYLRGRNNDAAETELHRAIAADPTYGGAYSLLGEVYAMTGRNQEAATILEQAVHLDPTRANSYTNLGLVYQRLGEGDKAIAIYRRALALSPLPASIPYRLSRLLYAKGDPAAARRLCDQAIALGFPVPDAYRQAVHGGP